MINKGAKGFFNLGLLDISSPYFKIEPIFRNLGRHDLVNAIKYTDKVNRHMFPGSYNLVLFSAKMNLAFIIIQTRNIVGHIVA